MFEIITTKGELYDKCENMEELYDNFYYPLLVKHKELKKQLEELELQNFNLREDVMIKKMSLPNKKIKDKTFFDLYDMPTYENLLTQQKEFINYLQEELNVQIQEESIGCEITNKRYILEEILQKYKEIIGDVK